MILKMPAGGTVEVKVKATHTVQASQGSATGKDLIFELAQVVAWSNPSVVGNFVAYGRTGSNICIWLAAGSEVTATAAYLDRTRRYRKAVVC